MVQHAMSHVYLCPSQAMPSLYHAITPCVQNARKKIQALAQQLRLRPDHIDMAFYFFKVTHFNNVDQIENMCFYFIYLINKLYLTPAGPG